MRQRRLFWGIVILMIGVVLLLDNLGLFSHWEIRVWAILWPSFIILLGVRLLLFATLGRRHTTITKNPNDESGRRIQDESH